MLHIGRLRNVRLMCRVMCNFVVLIRFRLLSVMTLDRIVKICTCSFYVLMLLNDSGTGTAPMVPGGGVSSMTAMLVLVR